MFPDRRVTEVVGLLTGVPIEELERGVFPERLVIHSMDSLDTVELVTEIEEEYGDDVLRWAIRYLDALEERSGVRRRKSL
jgi:hypothetical protein